MTFSCDRCSSCVDSSSTIHFLSEFWKGVKDQSGMIIIS